MLHGLGWAAGWFVGLIASTGCSKKDENGTYTRDHYFHHISDSDEIIGRG